MSGSLCGRPIAFGRQTTKPRILSFTGVRWTPNLLAIKMTDTDENESLKDLIEKQDDLKQKIQDKTSSVSAAEEKAADLGLSQYGESTSTTTLEREGTISREEAGTIYADMSNKKLSYPQLVLDRWLDGLEDGLSPKVTHADSAGQQRTGKHKLVILGSGWGAHALMKNIDASKYDATLISPRNHFLFTPMLAGAATGTVELRSITESIRESNPLVDYLEATATDINVKDKKVECESVVCEGAICSIDDFTIPYDTLVVSVGASVNTFGIPGVKENCYFLKQVADADSLRRAIGNTFERANLPGMSDEERIRTLTFVVAGAGPTGVEFTGELKDFVEQDASKYWPNLLPFIRIKVVEASDRVLMQFESSMQATAVDDLMKRPTRPGMEALHEDYVQVLLKSAVAEVTSSEISLKDGTVVPYGIAVWAAGIGPLPITLSLRDQIGEEQQDPDARGRLVVDRWLRVQGTDGAILSMGDCTYIKDYSLPATAQVAAQQGAYLGRQLSKEVDYSEVVPTRKADTLNFIDSMRRKKFAKPFQFLNLGILAYTGSSNALAQVEVGSKTVEQSGNIGWLAWRSVYLAKQVSFRNQAMVAFDWMKTALFGRDLTRF